MNNPVVRGIIAGIVGVLVAGITVGLVEAIGHMIFPPPADLDLNNPDDLERLMSVIPLGAKIAVLVAWFIGALVGALVAGWIGKGPKPGWVVAAFMIVASVVTTQMFPHPVWMVVGALVLPIVAKLLADRSIASRISP